MGPGLDVNVVPQAPLSFKAVWAFGWLCWWSPFEANVRFCQCADLVNIRTLYPLCGSLWAPNCGYVGLYGSVNAPLIYIEVNQAFWHDSVGLELYPGEGGGSQAIVLHLLLSVRMKWIFFSEKKRKREREKPHLSSHNVSVTSGSAIVTSQWAWYGAAIAYPHFASWLQPHYGVYFWFALYFSHCCTLACICTEPLLLFHETGSSAVICGSSWCIFIEHLALLSSPSPLCAEELCRVHWDSWHCGWDLPPLRSDIQHTKAEVRAICLSARGIWSHFLLPFCCYVSLLVPQAQSGANRALRWCRR